PQARQHQIAAAIDPVEFVSETVLAVEILMIVLGGKELPGRQDFGRHHAAERLDGSIATLFGKGQLILADSVDRRGIAVAAVAELATIIGRIDRTEEQLDQTLIGNDRRVE